jgi:hypothetical protein
MRGIKAILAGQLNVHKRHVGLGRQSDRHDFVTTSYFSHNLNIGL